MRRLLFIGDAAVPSGFARATHYICDYLDYRSNPDNPDAWDVSVIGLNYRGDPHKYKYDIYPASLHDRTDLFGLLRIPELIQKIRPDVVVIQNDPWNILQYLKLLRNVPVVAAVAVDGENQQGRVLNGLQCAVFWTQWGADQVVKGGYKGPYAVIPLGLDTSIYRPKDKARSRDLFFRPEDRDRMKDAYIVSQMNRNQPRKRMDLTISYFCQWVKDFKRDDAYLHLHVAPTGDQGYDVHQLMVYHGLAHRLILSAPDVWIGVSEETMCDNYNISDCGFFTPQGEGWGLTVMEMMGCGKPCIVPKNSAMLEWPEDAVMKVNCGEIAVTINNINVVGSVMDRDGAIMALEAMYSNQNLREEYGRRGLELVRRPEFDWKAIGAQYHEAIEASLDTLGVRTIKA